MVNVFNKTYTVLILYNYTKINLKWDHTSFLIPTIKSRKATKAMENRDDLYLEGNRYARTTNPAL